MYEKILVAICTAAIVIGVIWFVCRRDPDRRTGRRIGSDSRRVRDNIESAERRNSELEDAERATSERLREQAETIERAGRDNQRSQELVSKAKSILNSAKHTD